MTKKRMQHIQTEFEQAWISAEWLFRRQLEPIHRLAEKMIGEMITLGVPSSYIAEELPKRFEKLKREIVGEDV